MVASEHGGLPHLALLAFTVAQQGVDAVILVIQLAGKGHAHRGGDALTQRAGAHVHAGGALHVRMALEHGADVAELLQLADIEIAAVGQHRIQAGGAVALGEHKAVPVGVLGGLGVDVHLFEVEIGKDVRRGEGASRMAGLGVIHAFDDAEAYLCRGDQKVLAFLSVHSQ